MIAQRAVVDCPEGLEWFMRYGYAIVALEFWLNIEVSLQAE